jgi:hypothetical protein
MLLGFKPHFVRPILDGVKIHSIRGDARDRWHAGNSIQMATGVRTRQYHCFKEGTCKSIQRLAITWDNNHALFYVSVDGRELDFYEVHNLSISDGFTRVDDFLKWFNRGFEGKIIHWTDFRY